MISMQKITACALLLLLAACASQPPFPGQKVGKPYSVEGKTYYPEVDRSYDEEGMASWYGPGFHGKYTANGEIYNQRAMTAAHPTLPLPSMVRVTNLKNGRSAVVRVNDRGPFKSDRIIDLSEASAQALGIKGVAKVRVKYLDNETQAYLQNRGKGDAPWEDKAFDFASIPLSDAAPVEQVQREDLPALTQTAANTAAPAPAATKKSRGFSLISQAEASEIQQSDLPPPVKNAPIANAPIDLSQPKPVHLEPANQEIADEIAREAKTAESTPEPVTAPKQEIKPTIKPAQPENPLAHYVQVGAFSSRANADKMVERLRNLGNVHVDEMGTSSKPLFRVRIGPYTDLTEANRVIEHVHQHGIPQAVLTK